MKHELHTVAMVSVKACSIALVSEVENVLANGKTTPICLQGV
jgi:hypothetical protein